MGGWPQRSLIIQEWFRFYLLPYQPKKLCMKKYVALVAVILFCCQSCINGKGKDNVQKNDHIDADLKKTLKAMNEMVYKNLSDNNYPALSTTFSDSLKNALSPEFEQRFMPQIQRILKGRTYKVLDEFYVQSDKINDTLRISSGTGNNAYTLTIPAPTKETLISLLLTDDTLNSAMITLVHCKFDGKWKLNVIRGDDYSLNRKNAGDLYEEAQQLYKQHYLLDAINVMSVAIHCSRPAGVYFKYTIEPKMTAFNDSLTKETKAIYPFPYLVNQMGSKPQIFNLHVEMYEGRLTPMIMYKTIIGMPDTVMLKKENDEMQQKIGSIFTGMDKVNKSILYRAYNELPDANNKPAYYGFVQHFK